MSVNQKTASDSPFVCDSPFVWIQIPEVVSLESVSCLIGVNPWGGRDPQIFWVGVVGSP